MRLLWLQEVEEESFGKGEAELILGCVQQGWLCRERCGCVLFRNKCTCYLECGKAVHFCPVPSPLLLCLLERLMH